MTSEEKFKTAIDALKFAAETFRDYENIHLSKTPPDRAKAERNGEYALKIETAIESINTPPDISGRIDFTPVMWARDVDGTGSLHACSQGDPGAVPLYITEITNDSSLRDAFEQNLYENDCAPLNKEERIAIDCFIDFLVNIRPRKT